MEQESLGLLIRDKLAGGRLPCNTSTAGNKGIQFDVGCVALWDADRGVPGRGDSIASDALPKHGPGE